PRKSLAQLWAQRIFASKRGESPVWDQVYMPVGNSLALSAACAAIPILVLFVSLGIVRLAAWKSGLLSLAAACIVARAVYGMPLSLVGSSAAYGAAFGF